MLVIAGEGGSKSNKYYIKINVLVRDRSDNYDMKTQQQKGRSIIAVLPVNFR